MTEMNVDLYGGGDAPCTMHYYYKYREPGLTHDHQLDSPSCKSIAAELVASLRGGEKAELGAVYLPPIPTEFPPLPDLKLPDYKKVPKRASLLLRHPTSNSTISVQLDMGPTFLSGWCLPWACRWFCRMGSKCFSWRTTSLAW